MKRLKGEGLIRVFVFLLFHLFTFSPLTARPQLKDLNIQVVLSRNGDARITETRQMTIDSEGTECYIVIGNLNGSDISDLTVSDETGRAFTYTGAWDIDRSRDWKEGKCGIVSKHNGYELCWGLQRIPCGSRLRIRVYGDSVTKAKLASMITESSPRAVSLLRAVVP